MHPMAPDAAETLALRVLSWLAAEPERIGPFLAQSGLGPGAVRARASDPEFLGFVLDHLLSDEALLLDCMAALGLPPERAAAARAGLPGGNAPHWT